MLTCGAAHFGAFLPEPLAPAVFGDSVTDTHIHHSVHGADKADEVVPAPKPSRAAENMAMESRVATIKPRPSSRCFPPASDANVSGWGPGPRAGLPRPSEGGRAPHAWSPVVLSHAPHAVLSRSPNLGPTRGGRVCPGPRTAAVLWGWEDQQVLRPQLDTHGLQPRKARDRRPLPRVSMSPSGPGHCGRAGPGARLTPALRLQSVYERQGIAVMTPTVPGSPKGPCLGLPRGTMRRQKSIGKERGLPRRACPWSGPTPATPRPARQRAL